MPSGKKTTAPEGEAAPADRWTASSAAVRAAWMAARSSVPPLPVAPNSMTLKMVFPGPPACAAACPAKARMEEENAWKRRRCIGALLARHEVVSTRDIGLSSAPLWYGVGRLEVAHTVVKIGSRSVDVLRRHCG